jgi:putative glutamine amidotransferase
VATQWASRAGSARSPTIGIAVSGLVWDRAEVNPAPYAVALARAGAKIVTIDRRGAAALDGCDGLLLIGGGDIDPALAGGGTGTFMADRAQDEFEIGLIRRAEERGIPVLGICRGAQLIAVAHGGALADLEGDQKRRHAVSLRSLAAHEILIEPGSRLHARFGAGPWRGSSTHDQAIVDPGPRLRVTARSDDGVIEAVELPGPRMVIGLQWHPELESLAENRMMAPFRMLVEAAGRKGAADGELGLRGRDGRDGRGDRLPGADQRGTGPARRQP